MTRRARSQSPARLVGKFSPLIGASTACPLRDIDPFAHPGRRNRTAQIDGVVLRDPYRAGAGSDVHRSERASASADGHWQVVRTQPHVDGAEVAEQFELCDRIWLDAVGRGHRAEVQFSWHVPRDEEGKCAGPECVRDAGQAPAQDRAVGSGPRPRGYLQAQSGGVGVQTVCCHGPGGEPVTAFDRSEDASSEVVRGRDFGVDNVDKFEVLVAERHDAIGCAPGWAYADQASTMSRGAPSTASALARGAR